MIQQKRRKVGNSYVVTIPKKEIERRGLRKGQLLAIEIQPVEAGPVPTSELQDAFDASWERNATGYRYLADRLRHARVGALRA